MAIEDVQSEVNDIANWIRGLAQKLHDLAFNSIVGLLPGIGSLVKSLSDAANTILSKITTIGQQVKNQLGQAVGDLVPNALNFIAGIINNIGQDIHWLLSNLATAEQFAAGFVTEAAKHVPGMAKALEGALSGGVGSGLLGLFKFLEGQDAATIDHLLDELLKEASLIPAVRTMIEGVRHRGAEWQVLVVPLVVGILIVGTAEAFTDPMQVNLRQVANARFKTLALDPSALVEARLKNSIQQDEFLEGMAENNLNAHRAGVALSTRQERLLPEEAARLVFRGKWHLDDAQRELAERGIAPGRTAAKLDAIRPILSEDEIRQIFLRGIVNDATHDALMAQHGYTPDVIARRKSLYYLIPGPQDLIHMAIRNVFSDEIVKRFELFGDFPPAFEHAAAMQGISRDWALKYWGAHWIVPSNQEGFEMFQRTTDKSDDPNADTITLSDGTKVQNIIGRSTLQLLLREKDTAPYYRHKLTEIAYRPLTRIDVRRMNKVGSLNHAGVQRAYLNLGYSPENALLLADYVQKLNSQESKDQYASLINGLSRRILTYYGAGKLDKSDATMALGDLGLTDDEIGFYLAEEDLLIEADNAQAVEAGVGKLYSGMLITADQAAKRLTQAGVTDVAIQRLFSKWNLALEFKGLSAEHHAARDLTKSEIIAAVRDKLMPTDQAESRLQALGYDPDAVKVELALAEYQDEKQTKQAQIDALKALYINGVRAPLDVSNNLDALGLNVNRRDALLAEWQLQREQRTEKIPQATIRDMVISAYITYDDGLAQLRRHRLSDDDARLMLDFWLQKSAAGGKKRG